MYICVCVCTYIYHVIQWPDAKMINYPGPLHPWNLLHCHTKKQSGKLRPLVGLAPALARSCENGGRLALTGLRVDLGDGEAVSGQQLETQQLTW